MKRRLGRSDLLLPPVVVGGNVFGWTVDAAQSFRLLDVASADGLNAIDTADVYSNWVQGHRGGESETLIGDWMRTRGNRSSIIVATKVGLQMPDGAGLSPAWIAKAVDGSLRRLRTDYIDLYQAHLDDVRVPLADTLGAFADLIQAGKVRAIGCSNFSAERMAKAIDVSETHGLPRFESIQPEYNLIAREKFEGALASLCAREQIGAISYFALAAGFLSGKYRDRNDLEGRARSARVQQFLTPRNLAILDRLIKVSENEHEQPSTVALAWLLSRPSLTAPIVSATSENQLQDIFRASQLKLSADCIRDLDEVSSPAGAGSHEADV